MHRSTLLFCCALLGLTPGCAKSDSMERSRAPVDYDSAASGAAAPAEPAPEAMATKDWGSGDYEKAIREETVGGDAAAGPSPVTVPASPAPTKPVDGRLTAKPKEGAVEPGKGADAVKEPQKQVARQIIYTAEMGISVFKFDEAMARAEALTLEAGGYVQSMSQGYYVLRVPAARLRGVMTELGKLGVVESRSLQAQDVTEEFVDLTTRIRVLRETQAQLLTLLKQARNVDEALHVRRSLDEVTMQLEQAMGRLRMLEGLIGFSTLTVRMSQRGPQNAVPSSNDPFPWVDSLGVEATEWN